jgi:NAD(P)-dependent dehydrogenase (short-subunit alcohol dehydrogenase family)
MITATSQRQQESTGQSIVVIGDGVGIVLETARRIRAEGAGVILIRPQPRPPGAGRGWPAGTDRPCDGEGRRSCLPLSLGDLP